MVTYVSLFFLYIFLSAKWCRSLRLQRSSRLDCHWSIQIQRHEYVTITSHLWT